MSEGVHIFVINREFERFERFAWKCTQLPFILVGISWIDGSIESGGLTMLTLAPARRSRGRRGRRSWDMNLG